MPYALNKRVKAGWRSLNLDSKMAMMMFKGSVPVAVSLGMYQSTAVSEVYTSLGFLISIIAVVTVNLLPRAKLVQLTLTVGLFTLIAIPVTMLATWSGLQARFHTDPKGLSMYNSSQSAITGVWLFFNIVLSNSLQARYPALLIPTILYNIFVIVQFTSCPRFHTWKQCWDLIYLTTKCYFTGMAISFVSGLIIYPVTCRTEIFEVQKEYIEAIQDMLKGTTLYLGKLQKMPTFSFSANDNDEDHNQNDEHERNDGADLRQKMAGVRVLYIKMHEELAMAKREIAWGKLRAKDINSVNDLCRNILMPMSGMARLPDILQRIVDCGGWTPGDFESRMEGSYDASKTPPGHRQDEYETVWKNSISALVEPVTSLIEAMYENLEHAGLQLEIIPRKESVGRSYWMSWFQRTVRQDPEANGNAIKPGNPEVTKILEHRLTEFLTRIEALTSWADCKGLPAARFHNLQSVGEVEIDENTGNGQFRRDNQQLYLILYIRHMVYTTGVAVLELSKYSNEIVAEGIMSKSHLIVPSPRRLLKWFLSIWDTTDAALADDDRPGSKAEKILLYRSSNRATHNIEHLPPRNAYERFGVHIRGFQDYLRGPELEFGFRSGCATMSCAIVAYLHQTQEIFTHYRLIWAVIIAAIGANMSAGQSGVSYVLRILGSFAALIICYLVWYIPNGNIPGIIVCMWFASFIQMYFLIRWPKYLIGWLVILITEVLSIGYELQVRKLTIAVATAGGTYWFAPYYVAAVRVACVLWGTGASILFTYLPYPITARGILRKDVGVIMHLLASYHAVVHATIKNRLSGNDGDTNTRQSRGKLLSHARKAMFNKIMVLSALAKHNVYLQKYEPSLGGRFPVAIFEDVLSQLTVLLDYISLLSYATQVWEVGGPTNKYFQPSRSEVWLSDLSKLVGPINPTEEKITSILIQISAAVSTGRALPPGSGTPTPFQLSERLKKLDPDILDLKNMQDVGYSAYAVMEIISTMITHKISILVATVEKLVGVVNFDFTGGALYENDEVEKND